MKTDRQLINDYVAGAQSAFEALYNRHWQSVYAFARNRTGNHHEAEDAAQSAFASLALRASRVDWQDNCLPWLLVCVRRYRVQRSIGETFAEQWHIDAGPHRIDSQNLIDDVEKKIAKRDFRIMQRIADGESLTTIAESLGINYDHARRVVRQLRQRMTLHYRL